MNKTAARKPRKPQLNLEVVERRELSPGMVRVVCSILNHEDYQDIAPPEKYVKLVFFSDGTLSETPAGEFPDYWSVRETAAAEDLPVTRHMTLRRYDAAAGTLWIDVALHGTEGHAGPWAATAKAGDHLVAGHGVPLNDRDCVLGRAGIGRDERTQPDGQPVGVEPQSDGEAVGVRNPPIDPEVAAGPLLLPHQRGFTGLQCSSRGGRNFRFE